MKTFQHFSVTLLLLLFLASCNSGYIREPLTILPAQTDQSVELGLGVWMEIPQGFTKARTFEGYQAPNAYASISVMLSMKSIEEVKAALAPDVLRKKKTELLQLSSVSYDGKENGVFAVMRDKKTNTIRYVLAISYYEKTYYIKAFCFEQLEAQYDPIIKASLLSTYIGNEEDSRPVFKIAKYNGEGNMILTKDGEYPTLSEDEAVIEWRNLDDLTGISETGLVENELQKLTGVEHAGVSVEYLSDGKYYSGSATNNNKKAYIGLAVTAKRTGILTVCYGNANSSLAEFEKHTYGKLVKTKIVGAQ